MADLSVEQPVLGDYKKFLPVVECPLKFACELSENSAEQLRNEQEMDMLGDIPIVDNIMEGLDFEGLDFSDLIVGEDDEPATAENSIGPINGCISCTLSITLIFFFQKNSIPAVHQI